MSLTPFNSNFRRISWLFVAIFGLISSSTTPAQQWDMVKIGGYQYVSGENVARFYKIDFSTSGNDSYFKHPSLVMKWSIGSQIIYVNNIKFNLSLPIKWAKGNKAMISTIDLLKLIDPVVRPSFIKKPISFDTVVIDPGHGGYDPGAKGSKGMNEDDYNLDLSLRLEASLKKRGFTTVMTRRTDDFIKLEQRVAIANAQKRAIFISIHHNSSPSRSAKGVETFALTPQGTSPTGKTRSGWSSALNGNARDAENIALATAVHAHVIHDLRPFDRGIKRDRFKVLTGINKPAILYEGGFLTNSADATNIHSPAYRQRAAESIAEAVVKFKNAVGKKN